MYVLLICTLIRIHVDSMPRECFLIWFNRAAWWLTASIAVALAVAVAETVVVAVAVAMAVVGIIAMVIAVAIAAR